ncbi:MAG: RNA methyltransferase [Bacteroidia bacterium]|nr:RNA methyltransferase [Bacteroidia bacterium]
MVARKHFRTAITSAELAANSGLLQYLQTFLTDNKKELFEKALSLRTRFLACVMENVIDEHNTNAVIRSCECTGVQDVYIISGGKGFKPAKGVMRGSGKWSTLIRYNEAAGLSAEQCMNDLKNKGYRIVVTSPHGEATPLSMLEVSKPLAVCFGHEQTGISQILKDHADELVKIPMAGFTESFNVSVAAGIILYDLTRRIRNSNVNWNLSEPEKQQLRFEWTWKCLNRPDLLTEEYFRKQEK